jgi:hypothetical protein
MFRWKKTEEEPIMMSSFLNAPPTKEVFFFLAERMDCVKNINIHTPKQKGFMLGL